MSDNIILPSLPSISSLTISDYNSNQGPGTSAHPGSGSAITGSTGATNSSPLASGGRPSNNLGFGYNPSIGPSSNLITEESASLLFNKKTISVTPLSTDSIYDRNVNKKGTEINLSSLSFLFCEIVSWVQSKSKGIQDLEARLNGLGYQIGQRYLELVKLREGLKYGKREIKIIEILQFIHGPFWKAIFGKIANELEKSQDVDNEYMITDNVPLLSKFISVPKDYGNLNVSAFIAGIIEGALDSSFFQAEVSAHSVPRDGLPLRTTFLIKFDQSVLIREEIRFNR